MDDDTTTAVAGAVVRLGELALDFARVNRITFQPDAVTPESDTDHTVMLGLVACSLAKRFFPHLSVGKVAEYCLVHDLPEVYAGDTPTLRALTVDEQAEKRRREADAHVQIDMLLGDDLPWVSRTIGTYEDQVVPEARFVKMVDKILPKITHIFNDAATINRHGMTRAELAARYEQQGRDLAEYAAEFPEIEELRTALVEQVLRLIPDPDQYLAERGATCGVELVPERSAGTSSRWDGLADELDAYVREHAPLPMTGAAPDWSEGTAGDALRRAGLTYAARAAAQPRREEEQGG